MRELLLTCQTVESGRFLRMRGVALDAGWQQPALMSDEDIVAEIFVPVGAALLGSGQPLGWVFIGYAYLKATQPQTNPEDC